MNDSTALKWISFAFAVVWTGAMLWWSAPLDAAAIVIWPVAGAVAGLLWYWLMSRWQHWYFGPKRDS
ncbi:hypothetical protein [Methylobacterium oryzisoli]|uniref:hypothetical protein n=1 Tax=Methylobacterium oryzisoli TaxID=3385502 RepID=UPI003892A562